MSEREHTLTRLLQEVVGLFPLGLSNAVHAHEFDDLPERIGQAVGNPLLTGVCKGVEALEPADREWAEGVWRRWEEIQEARDARWGVKA